MYPLLTRLGKPRHPKCIIETVWKTVFWRAKLAEPRGQGESCELIVAGTALGEDFWEYIPLVATGTLCRVAVIF